MPARPIVRRKRASPKRTATMEDVCRALNVSTATVSRALNDKAGVGDELRQKVLAAVKHLNYVPRAAARDLSRARTDTIGIVFQDITSGWLLTIFRGIMSEASGQHFHVITSLSTREGDELFLPTQLLAAKRVDGLVWLDPRATSKTIEAVRKTHVPFVLLQPQFEVSNVSSVSIEGAQGAWQAVRHLLRPGRRRLVVIAGPLQNEDARQKMMGVERAAQEFGVKLPADQILAGEHMGEIAVQALARHLERAKHPPEAIFCFNDEMALAVLHWLRRHGHRVPEDIALVGFDGIPEAESAGLTTVATPLRQMGTLATQRLIEMIKDPAKQKQPSQILLRGELLIRQTCGG